jgi:quercetin dioxygenase-like cupin family protein
MSHEEGQAMRQVLRVAVGVVAVLVGVLVPGVAVATPPSGVSGTVVWEQTVGGTDYVLREVTVQPGGTTGWHWHDGTLYAYVRAGTLTHDEADCTTEDVYHQGQAFVEPSGAGNVHVGRNLGAVPVVLEVLYVDPAGSPLSEDAPDPGCGI